MARHARREGELVLEGVLAADKALLWNSIKDKPKVTCASCGESFTRYVPFFCICADDTGCIREYMADCAGWTL